MILRCVIGVAALLRLATAYAIPSNDGFPAPDDQQLLLIETQAGGVLSDEAPPPKLSEGAIANFQLIAFNEQFEVAFFSSLIENITNNVEGYQSVPGMANTGALLEILKNVKAQEELHVISAKDVLKHFNASLVPEPCEYKFPTTDLESALSLAVTFTSVVLGTLADAEKSFADNGDAGGVIRQVASIIGQEGEQNGFYRFMLKRKPSDKPFLTTNTGAFAYSALQQFIVSCPFDVNAIPIPILPQLQVLTKPEAKDMTLSFAADLSQSGLAVGDIKEEGLFITYLTGQQIPISEPISNVQGFGSMISFEAKFPYAGNIMEGLSIAALTNSSKFADADDVPANTLAAPGLIEVNEMLHGY
ncbi:late sexual development protein [Truncatella angustata]|uniref:Late sexual development protein n=1 Tax=Truncatella angustata TaxID=152316 RepID=A0A9P9A3E9_9PEZI|nr:late sexual development protein [Truncatella angustata]KAH6659180.1 late sexual development protein [Truncatella angustata]